QLIENERLTDGITFLLFAEFQMSEEKEEEEDDGYLFGQSDLMIAERAKKRAAVPRPTIEEGIRLAPGKVLPLRISAHIFGFLHSRPKLQRVALVCRTWNSILAAKKTVDFAWPVIAVDDIPKFRKKFPEVRPKEVILRLAELRVWEK